MREPLVIKYIFYTFKIFGLFTLKINTVFFGNEEKIFITHSKNDIVYNMFLISLVVLLNYFKTMHLLKAFYYLNKQLTVILIRCTILAVNTVIIIFVFCLKQKKIDYDT